MIMNNLPCIDCKLYKVCTQKEELHDKLILGYITCGDHSPINIIRESHTFPCEVYPVTGTYNRNLEKRRAAKAEALKKAEELCNAQSLRHGKGEESAFPLKARLNEVRTSIVQLLQMLELLIGDE